MNLSWVQANEAMAEINSRNFDYDRKKFIVSILLCALAKTEGKEIADCLIQKYDLNYNSEGAHPFFDKTMRRPLDPTQEQCGEYMPLSNISPALMAEIARAVRRETVRSGSRKKEK